MSKHASKAALAGSVRTRVVVLSALWCVWLHLLRNLAGIFIAVQIAAIIAALVEIYRAKAFQVADLRWVFAVWGAFVYAALVSFFGRSVWGNPEIGLVRMGFIMPVILLGAASIRVLDSKTVWRAYSLLCTAASLSIMYQWVFGPVQWFADASERLGFARYASLVGSLTVYGTVCGVALLIAGRYFRGIVRVVLVAVLVSGALLSLQKAAVANVVLVAIIGSAVGWISRRTTAMVLAGGFLLVVYLDAVDPQSPLGAMVASTKSAAGILENADDVSLQESAADRWQDLPKQVVAFYGTEALVTGVGVFGGSGSLGYEDLPMTHNSVGDLFVIFGAFVGGSLFAFFGLLCWSAAKLLWRDRAKPESDVSAGVFVLSCVNALFASGNLFQPVIGFALWYAAAHVVALGRDGGSEGRPAGGGEVVPVQVSATGHC